MVQISEDVGQFRGPQQQVAFGAGLQESAIRLSGVALKAKQGADELRVNDALNQARQIATDLQFNTEDGYELLKGKDALAPENGLSLSERVMNKFNTKVSEIQKTFSNNNQQNMFERNIGSLATSLRNGTEKYVHGQFVEFDNSVSRGTVELAFQNVDRGAWNDDEALDLLLKGTLDPITGDRLGGVESAIRRLTSGSETEKTAKVNLAKSALYARAIAVALDNNNIVRAAGLYQQHQKVLVGDDKLTTNTAIKEYAGIAKANSVSAVTVNRFEPNFNPTPTSRLSNILNIKTPEDADTLLNNVTEYPTLSHVFAAHDAGNKAVDKAIKESKKKFGPRIDVSEAQKDWLTHLPKKTQEFVAKNLDAFKLGRGAMPVPSKKEFIDEGLRMLPKDVDQFTLKETKKELAKQYTLQVDDRNQRADNVLEQTQKRLIELKGDFNKLSTTERMQLAQYPDKFKEAQTFANAIFKSHEVQTDDEWVDVVESNPIFLRDMSEVEFQQNIRTKVAPEERNSLIKSRNSMRSGTNTQSPDVIDTETMNDTISGIMAEAGLNPKTDIKRKARIKRFVKSYIFRKQEIRGSRLSPEETDKAVHELMTITAPSHWGWIREDEKLFDIEFNEIPSSNLDKIKDRFREGFGIEEPSDADILDAYIESQIEKAELESRIER